MRDLTLYPFEVRPLSQEEGGGYLVSFSDFSECISDGETPEEAIRNGMDALAETIAALEDLGLPVPAPGSCGAFTMNIASLDNDDLERLLLARNPRFQALMAQAEKIVGSFSLPRLIFSKCSFYATIYS